MILDLTLSTETRLLIDALRVVPIGSEISYQHLTGIVGRDVTAEGRGALSSARRIALRDHGAAFMVQRGAGLRRLPPEEAPSIGAGARRKVRRTAARALRDMTALAKASNGLAPEAQRKLASEMSALGLLQEIASDRRTATLAAEGNTVPPAIAAQEFLTAIGARPVAPQP